jgi:hypothetical protein
MHGPLNVEWISMVGVGEHFKGLPDFTKATELFNSVITIKLHTVHRVRS